MQRKLAASLVAVAFSSALLTPLGSPAYAAEETCQGQPATTVGTPGEPLRGTPGDDVIVANGASKVSALSGADLICVDESGTFKVLAGPGDDSVETLGGTATGLITLLGPGADTFVGDGRWFDTVYGDGIRANSDTETDIISTGRGRDQILSGAPGQRNNDVIDTGQDADGVILRGLPGPAGLLITGTKSRGDNLTLNDRQPAKWKAVGGDHGRIVADGAGMPITGNYQLSVQNLAYKTLVLQGPFFGTTRADRTKNVTQGKIFARNVGSIDVRAGMQGKITGRSSGDALKLTGPKGANAIVGLGRINLAQGRITSGGSTLRVLGIDSIEATGFRRLEYTGTGRMDTFSGNACSGYANGGGSRDRLSFFAPFQCKNPLAGFTLSGGGGPDELSGSRGNDVLIGGSGRDTGRGGDGRDRCRSIEVRSSC